MTVKPNYSWWIILGFVATVATLGACTPTYGPGYVRAMGVSYSWVDVPQYNGRAVYFDRHGRPMVNRHGAWYYVPHTSIRDYHVFKKRAVLCQSNVRNAHYAYYCGRKAHRRHVRNPTNPWSGPM